jgi:hypothetical protein
VRSAPWNDASLTAPGKRARVLQRVDGAFVDTVRQLIDTQLLSRAHLQAALCDADMPLISFERLVLLVRTRVLDAAVYAERSFASPVRASLLRDRLLHVCTAASGATTVGAAFVTLLLESDVRLPLLEQLLLAESVASDDESLMRLASFMLARVRDDEFVARLFERLLARAQPQSPAAFSADQLAPLAPTTALLTKQRDLFIACCESLGMSAAIEASFRAVWSASDTVRWSVVLPLLRCVSGSPEASELVVQSLHRIVDAAVDGGDQRLFQCCIVVARALEPTLEHSTSFPAFDEWLADVVGGVAKRARFVVHCLMAIVANDSPHYLQRQVSLAGEWARDLAPTYADLAQARLFASSSSRGAASRDAAGAVDELLRLGSDVAVAERVASWRLLQASWFDGQVLPTTFARTTWFSAGHRGRGDARIDDLVLAWCRSGVIDWTTPMIGSVGGSLAALAKAIARNSDDDGAGALASALQALCLDGADVGAALLACVCAVAPASLPRASAFEGVERLVTSVHAACRAVGERAVSSLSRAIERVLCAASVPSPSSLWSCDFALQICAMLARQSPCFAAVAARLSRSTISCADDAHWFVRRCAVLWDAAAVLPGARAVVPARVVLLLAWLGARSKSSTSNSSTAFGQHFGAARLSTALRLAGKLRRPLPVRSVIEFELALSDDALLSVHERAVWLRLGVAHALVREFRGDQALLCQTLLDCLVQHGGDARASSSSSAYSLILSVLQQRAASVRGCWVLSVLDWHDRRGAPALNRCIDALLLLPAAVLLGTAPSARDLRRFARWLGGARSFDVVFGRRDWSAHVANALVVHHATQPDATRALMSWTPLCARLAADWSKMHSAVLFEAGAREAFAHVDSIATLLTNADDHASAAWLQLASTIAQHAPATTGAALGLSVVDVGGVSLDCAAAVLRVAPPVGTHAFCYAVAAAFSAMSPAQSSSSAMLRKVREALTLMPAAVAATDAAAAALAKRFRAAFEKTKVLIDKGAEARIRIHGATERWKCISEALATE